MTKVYSKDIARFNKAALIAESGEHYIRVGCIAVVGGNVVSGAFNTFRNKQHNVPFTYATYHAETNVISSIPYESIKKSTLYIARISKKGQLLASKPCIRCMANIKEKKIKAIVYYNGLSIVKEKI